VVTVPNPTVSASSAQPIQMSTLFTATDAANAPIVDLFEQTTSGGGHFVLNGTVEPVGQLFGVDASQISQLTFVPGPGGSDDLLVGATDGLFSGWSTLHINVPTLTVGAGQTVDIASPYSGTVTFASPTGTLKLDASTTFRGAIGGQLAIGDVIDLADVNAGANATLGYSGNSSPGTLTVSDGTHTASIALLGNYSLANFTASSDGHGGTSVVDPPLVLAGDPAGGLSRQMVLFSQSLASFAPSDGGSGRDGAPLGYDPSQSSTLAHPVANQQHA
jgi:hypothetical protein